MATVKKIKKAQSGDKLKAKADATRVKQPVKSLSKEEPTYKNLQWVGTPTKSDSVNYRKGFFEGKKAKKAGKENTSNAFGTSSDIRGYDEGYEKKRNGGKMMMKRADGSTSQRGLWDNIRAAKGSGKKPTAAMLKQEKKIKAKSK
jgi:hypothetical protein